MKTTYKLDGTNTIPNTLANTFSNSGPFQGSAQGVAFSQAIDTVSSDVSILSMKDENGVTLWKILCGRDTSAVTGSRTTNIEDLGVIPVPFAGVYDVNARRFNAQASPTTSSIINTAGVVTGYTSTASNISYYAGAKLVTNQTSTSADGLGVDVGTDYIRYYDVGTGDDIFVMYMDAGSETSTNSYGYTFESTPQSICGAPSYNSGLGMCQQYSTLTTTTAAVRSYIMNLNFYATSGTNRVGTYWIDTAGFDGDTLKVGANSNGQWVEFYDDTATLIAMLQFGYHPNGYLGRYTQTLAKSFPDSNYSVNNVAPSGNQFLTSTVSVTASSFDGWNILDNSNSAHQSYWSAWWIKRT